MIHHVSIPAQDPKHVAEVLAELMHGRAYQLPGGMGDCWIAVSGDEAGTMIEVFPEDMALQPGESEDEQFVQRRQQKLPEHVPFHVLLSVRSDLGTIQRIGKREGWRTKLYGRGLPGRKPFFHVVEFWVENRIMLELAPEDMMDAYMDLIQIPVLDEFLGHRQKQAA